MAKKIKQNRNAQVTLPLPVASGTVADRIVILGSVGLKGYTHTDRATTALIAAGLAAPGLKDGEATVELIGVSLVAELTLATTITQFDKVYRVTADGTYSNSPTSAVFVGYALQTLAAPGACRVAFAVA